ncbi:MAG TPA: hypothetical protein PLU71_04425 [Candidatus Dependentiae bacterium]|nr:hypothetical protein [Candidatus Dependentiae bacterium]HRQ63078.1 hypothetical protein [Candidatus Dependentiae bacterium]
MKRNNIIMLVLLGLSLQSVLANKNIPQQVLVAPQAVVQQYQTTDNISRYAKLITISVTALLLYATQALLLAPDEMGMRLCPCPDNPKFTGIRVAAKINELCWCLD